MFRIVALISFILQTISCDWVSEWMSPIQEQLKENPSRRTNNEFGASILDDENLRMVQVVESTERSQYQMADKYVRAESSKTELSSGNLKSKLEDTLQNARMLADTLKVQIKQIAAREVLLKDAIVNGRESVNELNWIIRSGVSTVLVSPIGRAPRPYIVRNGVWTMCRGVLRPPSPPAVGYGDLPVPKCLGQEVSTQPDPCVFNSVIKYETVPIVRRLEYTEDDFLCLKQSFNNTLERYLSVPRKIINETCQNGIIRSLEDNNALCGVRVMAEYSYYPLRGFGTGLPLEYCDEPDGSCKLVMAWHISNSTVENFEFLKNEQGFKKYFIKSQAVLEHVI